MSIYYAMQMILFVGYALDEVEISFKQYFEIILYVSILIFLNNFSCNPISVSVVKKSGFFNKSQFIRIYSD
jgi:hypothetical protein